MTDDTLSTPQTLPGANCIAPDTPPVGAAGVHSSNIGRRRWGKPLTALQIQNAKATGKGYKLPDARGLCLFVTARGTKSWRFRYYVKGEEQSPLPLGLYPAVSAKLARARRDRAIELLAEGKDPRAVMGKDLEVEDGNIGRQFETVAH
jgi:Arm DNA-binding domain